MTQTPIIYECVPDVKYIFVTIERLEAVLRSVKDSKDDPGRGGEGERGREFDEFLWESNA
ncbi:MAG: hypothetical protein EAZ60_06220 [Oscillatoriales cyanobacterium]|nr:MAG: hypothetical protein EAZ69_00995 [Oscillatoriales cyanobacterium]TAF57688.1 MAG: hypothetical protein EAZ60_06220 [Oscillatoriales cyanobacterium]